MRRILIGTALFVALALALGACSKEHGELVGDFPLPRIESARLADAQSVQLEWNVPDAAGVEEYRVYVGLYANLGYAVLDTMALEGSTTETSYLYIDPGLAFVDSALCATAFLCDSLYKYSYFRVSAVRGGVEGVPGPKIFPSW